MPITTCVFDAYGTLFDVSAAARAAAQEAAFPQLAPVWQALASDWRLKQLEYSWLRAVTGAHTDFWHVTQDALDYALEAHGLGGDPKLRARLCDLYWTLEAYPEVPEMLRALKDAGHLCAILSNGSADMLDGAVRSAGLGDLLDAVLTVDTVGIFKPAGAVYDLVEAQLGCARDEVLFASSNGWDAACATGYGFQTAWVNRTGLPMERLPWAPAHMIKNLTTFPDLANRC